jgi:hypothetical protein
MEVNVKWAGCGVLGKPRGHERFDLPLFHEDSRPSSVFHQVDPSSAAMTQFGLN